MRRFAVFAILFPPLAFLVAFWGMLQILTLALGDKSTIEFGQLVLLPLAYALTLVPAMLTALVDAILAKRKTRYRILWTAFAGYVFIFLPLATSMLQGSIHGPYLLLFGIIGAVPAAICSWLAGHRNVDM
ncbi:hypothetical protein ACFQZO_25985 [Bradyrhizobium sp. GCM10027634]|uniref:hypothetical protein n=1 Tax=unclassified Bradyrhizobium TaxID=2631580 RepID=UPI00263B8C2F|nr:hypothetical protein [Bradyrhizobium sp. WYCCWR 12677]MDN5004298.1 hypothetical protein [Bradyrhizobium sp. WYCCWR 12677]